MKTLISVGQSVNQVSSETRKSKAKQSKLKSKVETIASHCKLSSQLLVELKSEKIVVTKFRLKGCNKNLNNRSADFSDFLHEVRGR